MQLRADDFEKRSLPSGLIDFWQARDTVPTAMGPFVVEVNQPPDDELLAATNALVSFVADQNEEVLDKVFEHYLQTSEDRYWMKSCGVPRRLDRRKVIKFLRGRSIVVRRHKTGVSSVIYVNPQWEEEHKITLKVFNGQLQFDPD